MRHATSLAANLACMGRLSRIAEDGPGRSPMFLLQNNKKALTFVAVMLCLI